jgi:ATP-dependent helicase/nuclease subunit B
MPVNVLIMELSKVCADHFLGEKWILAPSLRAGHQWLLAVARGGQPVVNARVKTLASLALELAGPALAAKELELISPQHSAFLVEKVMRRLRRAEGGYLWRLPPSVRLAETVLEAIDAVRRAGLDAEDLKVERFEIDAKGRELRDMLTEYVRELDDRQWTDRAGLLELAIARLRSDESALARDVLVLVPEDVDAWALEQRLLDSLPAKQLISLAVDRPWPAPAPAGERLSDARLLRWLPSPAEAPAPCADSSARVFRAVGEVNEVRAVLRHCLAQKIPLDEVEILCTDVETYVPLIYETFAVLLPENTSLDEMPVTFQEGIPARKFRPGRALVAWLAWIQNDFPQPGLIQMIEEGLLDIPEHDPETISFARLATVLRSIGIGFGRNRYLDLLDDHQRTWALHAADPQPARDEDGEPEPDRRQSLENRLQAVQLLRGLVESLLALSPGPDDGPDRVLELAQQFLRQRTRRASQLDNYARRILIERIKEIRQALALDEEGASAGARAWLAALPDEAWVGGLGPRGGFLHVAHVLAGGHSGRRHTFVVGLDDGRFPGAGLQDPILLDEERQGISPDLPTSGWELAKRIEGVELLLARLRGTVTLSYSCHDLADDREMFPSSVVLSAFRILSGQHDGDQAALNAWLPPAESFAPDLPEKALTETEWWLWRMSGKEEVIEPEALVTARYPHLGRGFALARARESDRLTEFDGWIPQPGGEIDLTAAGGPIVSASRLETLGQCPLKYFFRYVLEVEPPEELTIDPEVWLDALSRGLLLHEVFEIFLKELIERGEIPVAARDEDRLLSILDARVMHYRREIPPPNEAVFRRERAQLRRTARIFLHEDAEYCRRTGNRPQFVEVSIGLRADSSATRLDTDVPVEVKLPDGTSLRVRGRIDRVDRIAGTDDLAIWDYKTGSSWKYTQTPQPFWEGRVVQHVLYLLAMNARLAALKEELPGARAARFGFFFPSEKAHGERIEFAPEALEAGTDVLGRLARIAARGAFLATTRHDLDCEYCEYQDICGDVAAVASASARKLAEPSNTILEPYRELRGHGEASA